MKKISWVQVCFTFVGVFLGAGFVSGQELWKFFACFGAAGLAGFLVSAGIMTAAHGALLGLVRSTGEARIGFRMTERRQLPFADGAAGASVSVFVRCRGDHDRWRGRESVGADGAGQRFSLGAIVTLVIFALALCGLQSLVASFSALVPVITVCAVIIAGVVISGGKGQTAEFAPEASLLRPNWYVSAATYAAYNLFGSLTTMIPLAEHIPDGKTLPKGDFFPATWCCF